MYMSKHSIKRVYLPTFAQKRMNIQTFQFIDIVCSSMLATSSIPQWYRVIFRIPSSFTEIPREKNTTQIS